MNNIGPSEHLLAKKENLIFSFIQFFIAIVSLFFLFKYIISGNVNYELEAYPFVTKKTLLLCYFILIFLFSGLASLSGSQLLQSYRNKVKIKQLDLLWCLFIFVFLFSFANYLSSFLELWMDELFQVRVSAKTIILGASDHFQTPVGYIFSHISNQIWGYTAYSVRFGAMVMGALGFVMFFLCAQKVTKNNTLASLFFITACLTNYYILNYSFEGRSQSVALFFLSLFLLAHINFIDQTTLKLKNFFYLYITCSLFILSIGFQPPFLVLFIYLSTLVIYWRSFNLKKFGYYFLSGLLSVITLTPFSYLNVKISPPKLQNFNLKNLLYNDYINFNFFDFSSLEIIHYMKGLSPNQIFLVLFIILGANFFISNKFKLKGLYSAKLALSFFATFYIFALFTYNFYINHINWPFGAKYFYVCLPVFYLSITFAIDSFWKSTIQLNKIFKFVYPLSAIMICLTLTTFNINAKNKLLIRWSHERMATNSIHKYLDMYLTPKDSIYCLMPFDFVRDCYDLNHYNEYINHYNPLKKLNLYNFEFDVDLKKHKKINPKSTRFSVVLQGHNHTLKKILPQLSFDKKHIIAVKKFNWAIVYIFELNKKHPFKLIHNNLSITEKGIYSVRKLKSKNFTKYVKSLNNL